MAGEGRMEWGGDAGRGLGGGSRADKRKEEAEGRSSERRDANKHSEHSWEDLTGSRPGKSFPIWSAPTLHLFYCQFLGNNICLNENIYLSVYSDLIYSIYSMAFLFFLFLSFVLFSKNVSGFIYFGGQFSYERNLIGMELLI